LNFSIIISFTGTNKFLIVQAKKLRDERKSAEKFTPNKKFTQKKHQKA